MMVFDNCWQGCLFTGAPLIGCSENSPLIYLNNLYSENCSYWDFLKKEKKKLSVKMLQFLLMQSSITCNKQSNEAWETQRFANNSRKILASVCKIWNICGQRERLETTVNFNLVFLTDKIVRNEIEDT